MGIYAIHSKDSHINRTFYFRVEISRSSELHCNIFNVGIREVLRLRTRQAERREREREEKEGKSQFRRFSALDTALANRSVKPPVLK